MSHSSCGTRIGLFLALVLLESITMAAQPLVTLKGIENHGLRLLPSSSAEFTARLDPSRSKSGDALLPFSVLLKNESPRNLSAWCIRWVSTDQSGKDTKQEVVEWNFATMKPEDGILVSGARLVSIVPGIGTRFGSGEMFDRHVANQLVFFARQRAVTVSIDVALFEDGVAVGDNATKWVERLKARLDAERDVSREALETSPRPLRERIAEIVERGFLRSAAPEQRGAAARLAIEVNQAQSYDEAYALMRGFFAAQLLEQLQAVPERDVLDGVRALTERRRLPVVVRQ